MCDAVTGREGSQALLEQAERAGLFLVPLDEVRGWWRYHHLFADLLRPRLQQRAARTRGAVAPHTPRPGTPSTGWQATGDPAGALEAITEAEQAAPGPAGLLNPVPARRARLLLAQGDLAAATRFAQDNDLGPDDEPAYTRESGHLVLARVLLAQDRSGQALALLDRLHAAAIAQGRTGSLIEIGALRALALAATGEDSVAVTVLAEALLLACPQGYVRVFADEGPPMAALLGRPSRPSAPARQPPASRSATWPGSSGPSAPGDQRLIPSLPASSTR